MPTAPVCLQVAGGVNSPQKKRKPDGLSREVEARGGGTRPNVLLLDGRCRAQMPKVTGEGWEGKRRSLPRARTHCSQPGWRW